MRKAALNGKLFSFGRGRINLLVALALSWAGLFGVLATAPAANATLGVVNNTINFQGRLLNAAGAVVADGTYNMEFRIYQDGTGTAAYNGGTYASPTGLDWSEDYLDSNSQGVVVKNGYFSVNLGSLCALSGGSCQGATNTGVAFNDNTLWLSMDVAGGANATASCGATQALFHSACSPDGEMLPMKGLSSDVYAQVAAGLTSSGGVLTATSFIQNQTTGAQTASYWIQGTADIAPTTNSVNALSVTGTTGTAATAVTIAQGGAADGADINVTNASSTAGSAISITKTGAGSLNYGLSFTGTTATADIYRGSGNLTVQAAAGNIALTTTQANASTIVKTATNNSTTAFQIQNSSSNPLLNADTTNMRLGVDVTYATMASPSGLTVAAAGSGSGNLSNSTVYYYKVTAIDSAGGETTPSTEQSATPTHGIVNLYWTAVTGATGYKIYRSAGVAGAETYFATVNSNYASTNPYQDAGGTTALPAAPTVPAPSGAGSLTSGVKFAYRIAAVDANGNVGPMGPETQDATATSSGQQKIAVSWAGVAGALTYNVYRTPAGTLGTEQFLINTQNLNYTDNGSVALAPNVVPPGATTAYVSSNVASNNLQLSVGGSGTPTGQLYVSGTVPTTAIGGAGASGPSGVVVAGHYAYEIGNGFQIYDIANPASPVLVGSNPNIGGSSVAIAGHYAYVHQNSTMEVVDISNPSSPTEAALVNTVGTDNFYGGASEIYASGDYVYDVEYGGDFLIYNVSNPTNPVMVTAVNMTADDDTGVFVAGRYAYVSTWGGTGLYTFDISNPASVSATPTASYVVGSSDEPTSVYVQGRYAYVTDDSGNGKLDIIDVSNPTASCASNCSIGVITTSNSAGSNPESVFVQGRYAYVTNITGGTLGVYDVSNPAINCASSCALGSVNTGTGSQPDGLFVAGRYAYVTLFSTNTLAIFDVGGEYAQQLQTGDTETGTLTVDTNANIYGDENISGGLGVAGNSNVDGSLSVDGTTFLQGSADLSGGVQGGLTVSGLSTPSAPTITFTGTTGTATTYTYDVVAVGPNGTTPASGTGSITTGDTTFANMSTSNYNTVTWNAVVGATGYNVYRTVGGTSQGKITSSPVTTTSFSDTGIAASGSAPTLDTSGTLTVNGPAVMKDDTNTTTAFQIQNAGGSTLLAADTTNDKVIATGDLTVGFTAAPGSAPTTALTATGWANANTTYYYEVTYVTADGGQTSPSPFATMADATQKTVTVSAIPTGPVGVVTGRDVYRTKAGATSAGPYYLDDAIADDTTTSYTDSTVDASLGASDGYGVNTTGYFSNPQGQSQSEVFGLGAINEGTGDATAFGYDAAGANDGVAMGALATDISSNSVAIGYNSQSNLNSVALGYDTNAAFTSSMALGMYATTTASNQLVIGGSNGATDIPIDNVYVGAGVTDANAAQAVTLQGSGSGATSHAGASLTVSGGAGYTSSTGSAGGTLTLAGGNAGGSGANSGANLILQGGAKTSTGTSGSVIVKPQSGNDSASVFEVQNAAGSNALSVNTINMATTTNDINVGVAGQPSGGGRLFSDGFETGSDALWWPGATTSGTSTLNVVTSPVLDGKYALTVTMTGSGDAFLGDEFSGDTVTTMDGREYVYLTSHSSGNINLMAFIDYPADTNEQDLYLNASDDLCWWNGESPGTGTCSSTVLTTSTWHEIELDSVINGSTGSATILLDGVSVLTQTSKNTGTDPLDYFSVGDNTAGRTGTYTVDDISIDTSSPGTSANLDVNDSLHVTGTASFDNSLYVDSDQASGMFAYSSAVGGNGVYGEDDTSGGNGVAGYSANGDGIYGSSTNGNAGLFLGGPSAAATTLITEQNSTSTANLFKAYSANETNTLFNVASNGNVGIGLENNYTSPLSLSVAGAVSQTGMYTPNSNGTNGGNWSELGECDIPGQYEGCDTKLAITETQTGATNQFETTVSAYAYQQNSYPSSSPYMNVQVEGTSETYASSDFEEIWTTTGCSTGSDCVKLYARQPPGNNWGFISYSILYDSDYPTWTWTPNSAFVTTASLPSGTVVTATYGDELDNSETITPQSGGPVPTIASVQEWDNQGTNLTTLTVAPHNIGDVMIATCTSDNITDPATTISGGGVTSWHQLTQPSAIWAGTLYEGVVTSTGSTSVTCTWLDSPGATTEITAQEFSATANGSLLGSSTLWSVVATGANTNGVNSTALTFPTLTTGALANEMYYGFSEDGGTPTCTPSTDCTPASFVPHITTGGDLIMYGLGLTPNTAYTPTGTQSSGNQDNMGVVLAAGWNPADSTASLLVQNTGDVSLLASDTVNMRVVIGAGSTGESLPALLVLDNGTTSSDPAGVNGAMYYNAAQGQFRCFEQSIWVNCVGPSSDEERQMPFYSSDMLGLNQAETSPFYPTNQGSGTAVMDTGDETSSHQGVVDFHGGTSANGGYTIQTDTGAIVLGGGDTYETVFLPHSWSGVEARFGFFDTNANSAVTNGAWVDVNSSGVATGYTSKAGTQANTGALATLSTGTWYRIRVAVNAADTVVYFYIYNDTTGAFVAGDGISTSIPTGTTGAGDAAETSTTTSLHILGDDYQAFWVNNPVGRL